MGSSSIDAASSSPPKFPRVHCQPPPNHDWCELQLMLTDHRIRMDCTSQIIEHPVTFVTAIMQKVYHFTNLYQSLKMTVDLVRCSYLYAFCETELSLFCFRSITLLLHWCSNPHWWLFIVVDIVVSCIPKLWHIPLNMGLDGGTIPTRGELVQLKKKPEQVRLLLRTLPSFSRLVKINQMSPPSHLDCWYKVERSIAA